MWSWGKNELVTLTEVLNERELKKRNEELQALNERLRLLQEEAEQIKIISFLELPAEKTIPSITNDLDSPSVKLS